MSNMCTFEPRKFLDKLFNKCELYTEQEEKAEDLLTDMESVQVLSRMN